MLTAQHPIHSRVPPRLSTWLSTAVDWAGFLIPVVLVTAWALVLLGVPALLPTQAASWLTFIAFLIAPGYFLADLITWRMDLDWAERLALALPLGVATMAVPGIVALLRHLTISQLVTLWTLASAVVLIIWLVHGLWVRTFSKLFSGRAGHTPPKPWTVDELTMLALLAIAFVVILPTLNLYKIDGDAYAVASFAADALAGLPLNATEPLFGTQLGPGVRMVFNQSLPLSYLWSYLSHIDPITLTATASRSMLALWAILAAYTLGKAAGSSRRFGLFTASIQLLIYLAAPFVRGDNVSLFFFERINADKFMVPVTMLPVIFAFAIRFVRDGRHDTWLAAAVAAFAVSTIHPLVAAMLALALAAFGSLHLVLALEHRIIWKKRRASGRWDDPWLLLKLRSRLAWTRNLALWGLVVIAMLMPMTQLVMARGEAPLAPSYPSSFEGWPIGQKLVPVLPFVHVPSLTLYGPLPELSQLKADQANSSANPFLIWRFAVNMNRRRLILFDLGHYISDPSIILEPPYLLALLLLPLLLWRIRSSVAAQFAVSTTLAVLLVMFNPLLTPLIGNLVMPWILWRMVWVIPYALIIALATQRLLSWGLDETKDWLKAYGTSISPRSEGVLRMALPLGCLVAGVLLLIPGIAHNLRNLYDRTASPYFYPTPQGILARLGQVTAQSGPVTVLADQDLSVTIPAYVANADIVAHRAPTTSEIFPAHQQDVALQRLIDQDTFFRTPYLTAETAGILHRYDVRYVITSSGSDIDTQLRLAPQWFQWLLDDQSYSLYAVHQLPMANASLQGNSALAEGRWESAEQLYRLALEQNPRDWLALLGLAEVAHAQGEFDQALARLDEIATQNDLPILHYHLGRLYAERGLLEHSIVEFDQAQRAAPRVTRFHLALGDACLSYNQESCAATQYEAAVANEAWSDTATSLIAQADLWRRRGQGERAVPLYEQAVALRPSEYNQFILARAYRELGQFDRADEVVRTLRAKNPLSAEVVEEAAGMMAVQNKIDAAIALYRYDIWLQDIVAQESVSTRQVLARLLLDTNRLDEAQREITRLLRLAPFSAAVHKLQGDLYVKQQQYEQAIDAYQRAFQLDPTQIALYVSLSNQLRQHGGRPADVVQLLRLASQINPGEATLLIGLGDQLGRLGDTPGAIEAYRAALDTLDPYTLTPQLRLRPTEQSRAFAYARLAETYEDLGQLEQAMGYYHAIVATAPEIPWTHIMLGDALRRRNNPAAAEASYLRAIQEDPSYVDAYLRLADLYSARGDTAEADVLYQQALQIALAQSDQPQLTASRQAVGGSSPSPRTSSAALKSDETVADIVNLPPEELNGGQANHADPARQIDEVVNATHVLARLYQVHQRPDQAIQLYQQKLQQGEVEGWSPSILAQFHKGLADMYLTQGLVDQAVVAYQQAVALDNWWPEARLALANALTARGDTAGALQQVQAAVDIAPGSVQAQVALANALDEQGQHAQALSYYQAAAQAHPGDARAALALAHALQQRHRWDEAEQSYRRAIEIQAGTLDAYVGLAEVAMDRDNYDEAEKLLQQAIQIDRQDISPYVSLYELEQRRSNSEAALDWFRQAANLPQPGAAINVTLYDSLLRYGSYATALAYVQEGLEAKPNDPELLYRLGRVQRLMGRYTEAETSLSTARDLNPGSSRVYAELAELYQAQGQPLAALALYQQAIELAPGEEAYYVAVSDIWASQGRLDQALATLQAGQAQVPQPSNLIAAQAVLFRRRGEPDQALLTLQQGLATLGEQPQLLLALATYYDSRADFAQADQHIARALELAPNDATLRVSLAELYLGREQALSAVEQYKQATAIEPGNAGYYLALADAYAAAGYSDEAIEVYSHTLSLAPTLAEAYSGLATQYETKDRPDDAHAVYERGKALAPTAGSLLVQVGDFLRKQGEEEQALALLERAVQMSPTAATLVARSAVYQEMGRSDETLQDLQSAAQKEPGSLDVLLALGDWYRAQKDMDQARAQYEQILSLMPGLPVGYLRLGALANEEGDRAGAESYVEKARQAEPGALAELGEAE